ncbi:MAG: ParB/RepB/Spo0J family partition protein [Candidatus Xenobia bacterium]
MPDLELLRVEHVEASTFNPRKHFDDEKMAELVASVAKYGVLEPIIVRPHPTKRGRYEIVAGERRWRAAKAAKRMHVPAIVRDLADREAVEIALVENLARADLNPVEEAEGYRQLQELGIRQQDIADRVNRSQPAVANSMRLLKLPKDVLEMIRAGKLTPSHGMALLRLEGHDAVISEVAKIAVKEGKSSANIEQGYWLHDNRLRNLVRPVGTWERRGFIDSTCKKCPFNAWRKVGEYRACLRPAHFEELEKAEAEAASARRTEDLERARKAAKAPARPEATWSPTPNGDRAPRRTGKTTAVAPDPGSASITPGSVVVAVGSNHRVTVLSVDGDTAEICGLGNQHASYIAIDRLRPMTAEEAAHREDVKDLPHKWAIPHDSFCSIDAQSPPGCRSGECACIGRALNPDDSEVPICTNPKAYAKQQASATRAAGKVNRGRFDLAVEQVSKRMDALDEVGAREMALIAWLSLNGVTVQSGDDGKAQRHLVGSDGEIEAPHNRYDVKLEHLDQLAQVPSLGVARYLLERALLSDLRLYYGNKEQWWGKRPGRMAIWYLGDDVPERDGFDWRTAPDVETEGDRFQEQELWDEDEEEDETDES